MRVGNALLVAGIVIVITALSGASFAADDGGRTPPGTDVIATEEAVEDAAPASDGDEPAEPTGDDEGDRIPDEVDTEEVAPEEDGNRGDGGRKESGGNGGRDRGDGREGDKQPLADVGVTMKNIQFKPKTITVKSGDEVTWTNRDTAQHDAKANNGDFDTDLLDKGQTATVPINGSGTIDYICTVHPTMKGKIVVSGGSGGKGGTSSGTGGTSSGTGSIGSGTSSGGFDSGFPSGSGSGSSGSGSGSGSLPNTGQAELPLLLFGAALIVVGLLARALREYWIWR